MWRIEQEMKKGIHDVVVKELQDLFELKLRGDNLAGLNHAWTKLMIEIVNHNGITDVLKENFIPIK